MSDCAWCGSTREATKIRSQTLFTSSSKMIHRINNKDLRHESASFRVMLPCCAVCDQFLDIYESKPHWLLRFLHYLPIALPIYMLASHNHFVLDQIRFDDVVILPFVILIVFAIINIGRIILNRMFAFEFRITYLWNRYALHNPPSGMKGRLGEYKGKNTVFAGDIRRIGDFGSNRYSISLYNDISIVLPIEGKLNKVLEKQNDCRKVPFSFDRSKSLWAFAPYVFFLYLLPLPCLIFHSYTAFEAYEISAKFHEEEVEMVTVEKTLLEMRREGQPMTKTECESKISHRFTDRLFCLSHSCRPKNNEEPSIGWDVVRIEQSQYLCPSISQLEDSLQRTAKGIRVMEEKYNTPMASLISVMFDAISIAFLLFSLSLEVVRNLVSFVRRRKTEPDIAKVDGYIVGSMIFVLGLSILGVLLAFLLL